jgi:alanyl-tRNA synthetase
MDSKQVRQHFFDFFESKGHRIVPSAPMVIKDDPTLMFTNAGMNQFKDYFLGTKKPTATRIANTQKCLRVSGKHNDLEEVGHDNYHHTMFEMLGNWSFGDYFKKEAIEWAWELLTEVYKINPELLYVTVFGGDESEKTAIDQEAYDHWIKILPKERILYGSKKDNFWEMGETGPCGPCSEIHVDLRNAAERKKISGTTLVNAGDPEVIEIWNLVFIEYNRTADGKLHPLPNKNVDTGMGFERLCRVLQQTSSNYDTDVFQPLISEISKITGIKYGASEKTDIAMKVICDHIRAISFSIADGQLPSNNKAGYVIRRILRRAIRYGYTFLNQNKPFITKLVPALCDTLGSTFPELNTQRNLIERVITEEENSFLKTLDTGIRLLDKMMSQARKSKSNTIGGKEAFELYDTFGFPPDLTELILREHGMNYDKEAFTNEMHHQKTRSKAAASQETSDWVELISDEIQEFVGYDSTETNIKITHYRKIKTKDKEFYQLVFDFTPFYAESGGQVGDTGYIESEFERILIIDTKKENDRTIHLSESFPTQPKAGFKAVADKEKRLDTACNHSATHLLHMALRRVLGNHVEQKGSYVHPDYLRFDFAHFQKLSDEELSKVELMVNDLIRLNSNLDEKRAITMAEAQKTGALAFFGEKYGDMVRVIQFGESVELCGGTHVDATGRIGLFKIVSEGAIAAGIRRIEAITSRKAFDFLLQKEKIIKNLGELLSVPEDGLTKAMQNLILQNKELQKELDAFNMQKTVGLRDDLISRAEKAGTNISLICSKVQLSNTDSGKDLVFEIKRNLNDSIILLGSEIEEKAYLWLMISENLLEKHGLNATTIIREISVNIQGGGGGQPFFATAGGKNTPGIDEALKQGRKLILEKITT